MHWSGMKRQPTYEGEMAEMLGAPGARPSETIHFRRAELHDALTCRMSVGRDI
jgi:hypothetical protein